MPREHQSRREVLDAIKSLSALADLTARHEGHFDYELDLEVVVYGRNYNGKKVGPYVRLLTYEPNETVISEGDWGGNTFFFLVKGSAEVFLQTSERGEVKVAEIPEGRQFGEMSVLAGVPRSATIKSPPDRSTLILEVQRPALRLLRKLSKFNENLDATYLAYGRKSAFQQMNISPELSRELIEVHPGLSQFKVFSRNHVLFRQNASIEQLYIVKEGWMRRDQEHARGDERQDFLGQGYCFGLDGVTRDEQWSYSVTLMGRSEVLIISIKQLNQISGLTERLIAGLSGFAPPRIGALFDAEPEINRQTVAAQERLINTGLVDATNLLVMDMDLCVRCGRCSMACHEIHGQSRLLRRGIHITRLETARKKTIQEVLAPSVCLHCQDPECLTGCPTGAIGRFSQGQIDIDAKTCIGCGDCATNCPYSAISMVPRTAAKASNEKQAEDHWATLRRLLQLKSDPLPKAVEQTDDLLAVKCNLCRGTPLNPEGSVRAVYGCEENCPTGSLARIDPRDYFSEIQRIEGLAYLDPHHAVGRNIHRRDPLKRLTHLIGAFLLMILTIPAVFGIRRYGLSEIVIGFLDLRWLTGLVGLIGIAGVMAYPVRRQIFKRRAGPLRYWMLAHLYLGVIGAVMIFLHGGTSLGGWLTTLLALSFDLVILTGLFGIFCYRIVPRLLNRIEGEPLLIDDLKTRRDELKDEIVSLLNSSSPAVRKTIADQVIPRFISVAFLYRQFTGREQLDEMLASARNSFTAELAALTELREREKITRAIEAAATLRRVDALIILHWLLKAWLPPHVVVTAAMLVLLLMHLIQVVYGLS